LRAEHFFRISIIDAGLRLRAHLEKHRDITINDAIRQLRAGPVFLSNLDYESAATIGRDDGLSIFCVSSDRTEELRETILKMAIKLKPFWAKVSPLGRERVCAVTSADLIQCLRYAGLLDSVEPSVWRWWDQLAGIFRTADSQRLLQIGREGEGLSLEYEKKTLRTMGIPNEPKWVSLEDNLAGYDIMSYRAQENGAIGKAFIEVKATTTQEKIYWISRREWNVALANRASYLFHFWLIPSQFLHVASVDEMEAHIPSDRGWGTWNEVRLDLSAHDFVPEKPS
jgi:hypothetical protein